MHLTSEASAKVNLGLAVTGRRSDGYHTLRSIFLRLALHDSLGVEVDADAASDTLQVDGEAIGDGPANLVLRAAADLREHIEGPLPALRFHLSKRIPVASGLGGGSSDASAALDLASAAWGLRLHPSARLQAGLRLGADVPFFSTGYPAALVSGIGEGLRSLPAPHPSAGVLLITPAERLSTAAVFAEFDQGPAAVSTALERMDALASGLRAAVDGDALAAASAALHDANDLWPAASRLSPTLVRAREAAAAVLGRSLLLSGSGPTLFALYPSGTAADTAAEELQRQRPPELDGVTIIATSTT